jgi:glycerol-3-phosphate dehydrogenase
VAGTGDLLASAAQLQRFAQHCRRFTQARTVADVLARRARLAFLDTELAGKATANPHAFMRAESSFTH